MAAAAAAAAQHRSAQGLKPHLQRDGVTVDEPPSAFSLPATPATAAQRCGRLQQYRRDDARGDERRRSVRITGRCGSLERGALS